MNVKVIEGVLFLSLFFTSVLAAQESAAALETESKTKADEALSLTADEVISDYIEAIGGEMVLWGLESMTWKADLDGLGNRENGKVTLTYSEGGWLYDFEMDDGRHAYLKDKNGKVWHQPPNWSEMSVNDKSKMEEIVPVPNAPLRWLEYPGEIEFKGVEQVGERPCAHVEFRPTKGNPVNRFFDMETKLLVKMTYISGTQPADWILSDYKNIDGCLIPMKRERHSAGSHSYVVLTKEVILNEEVDVSLFDSEGFENQIDDENPFAEDPFDDDDPFGDG